MTQSKLGVETREGYIDHLGIVSTESPEIRLGNEGIIYNEPGKGDITTELLCKDSKFRPITCSELLKSLSNKAFFNVGLTYLERTKNDNNEVTEVVKMRISPSTLSREIPEITPPEPTDISKFTDGILLNPELDREVIESLYANSKYLFGKDYLEALDIKTAPSNFPDLAVRPLNIQLITPSSDIYTDTLNLNEYIRHSVSPGMEGIVDLSIRFTTDNTPGYEYSMSSMFQAFKYEESEGKTNLIVKDFYQTNSEPSPLIQLEYMEGIIRIYPLSSSINECIINSCTITYAKSN